MKKLRRSEARRLILVGALSLVSLLVVGCAGYRLGPTTGRPAGAQSLQVQPFENKTLEPRLVEPLTSALRKSIQQEGTYRLATANDGDLIVRGVIKQYERAGVTYQPTDILSIQDYDLAVTVQLTARDRTSGKVLLDREIRGRTTIRVLQDQTSSERQALPILADDFARKATAALADPAW